MNTYRVTNARRAAAALETRSAVASRSTVGQAPTSWWRFAIAAAAAVLGCAALPATSLGAEESLSGACQSHAAGRHDPSVRTAVDVPLDAPWTRSRREYPAAIVAVARGRRSVVGLCLMSRAGHSRARSLGIILGPSERLTHAAVANRYVAWSTRSNGRTKERVSVRHIDAPPRNTDARTLAGRASDVVVTTTGDVAVDVRTAQGRRLQVSRPRHSLRTVSRAALGPVFEKGRGSLVSWGTRLVAVTEAPSGYIPDVVHPVDPATGRQVNDCKTGAPHVSRLESESVDARVANARSWAPAGTTAEKELTVCSPGGKRLLSRVLSEGDASDVTSDRVAVSVAGPVVVATRVRFDGGDSGTGTEVLVNRSAFVVAPDGRSIEVHVPQLVAASPAAVAFVDDGTLQISDADGFRSVVLAPPTVAGLYQLALEGSGAIVRTESGDAQSVPLRPLPARAVKSFGGGVSTTATIDSP